jgi:hypothetical protein
MSVMRASGECRDKSRFKLKRRAPAKLADILAGIFETLTRGMC